MAGQGPVAERDTCGWEGVGEVRSTSSNSGKVGVGCELQGLRKGM